MGIRIRPETLVIVAFVAGVVVGALLLIGLAGIGTLLIAAGLGCMLWFFVWWVAPAILWPFGDNPFEWPVWMRLITALGVALIVTGYLLIRLGGGFDQPDIKIPRQ